MGFDYRTIAHYSQEWFIQKCETDLQLKLTYKADDHSYLISGKFRDVDASVRLWGYYISSIKFCMVSFNNELCVSETTPARDYRTDFEIINRFVDQYREQLQADLSECTGLMAI